MIDAGEDAAQSTSGETREERLRAFISSLIPQSVEEQRGKAHHVRLIAWEMLSPTGAFDHVEEMEIKPQIERAKNIVEPFMPAGTRPQDLTAAALWLVGQCIVFRGLADNLRRDLFPEITNAAQPEELTSMISRLALRGLQSGIV